jgi:hypothetical protein
VVHTPKPILLHPAYNGGWKVLRHYIPDGGADLVMTHFFLSFLLYHPFPFYLNYFPCFDICLMFYVISPYQLVNKKRLISQCLKM